jgi:hypothetical protein
MSRAGDYLRIPEDYVASLDGLRWSEAGDAIETDVGATFALTQEIALFLEGLTERRPLIHFGHVLHLLHMLKRGGAFAALRHAYEKMHFPARNAGAFCALLCDDVPSPADPPSVQDIWHALMSSHYVATLHGPLPAPIPGTTAEMPPLGPLTFEERILRALSTYRDDEIEHWFRHGQGPVKDDGEAIARAVVEQRPRSLHGVLASLAQRERLAGAIPFVAQLVSALALPPRRLSPPELPLGGYADVSTRGQPEQVLPSQLAVDEMEFIRRFADNELLYFRREEPHSRLREELAILLDQGVRTWGTVRLVLTAAFFAFGKMAQRRGLPFRIATTGTEGRLIDPLPLDDAARGELGDILDASDLSSHPGLALESVLEEQSAVARDVVLLTHPRSLNEVDVQAAARRVTPGTRLFAVAVDERGAVELSELRHGTAVSLTRFRVDVTQRVPEPKVPQPAEAMAVIASALPWRGDVEAIGYPFRFGLPHQMLQGRFDFSQSGKWIMVACERGQLLAAWTDGSATEILPRGVSDGQALLNPETILGVVGGFVVAGQIGNQVTAFHYDMAERTCRVHKLGQFTAKGWRMRYVRSAHSIVAQEGNVRNGVDLSTGEFFSNEGKAFRPVSRVQTACHMLIQGPQLNVFNVPNIPSGGVAVPGVVLDPVTGGLIVHASGWSNFTPRTDGQPTLRGAFLLRAYLQGHTLVLYCNTAHQPARWRLYVYRGPEGQLVYESQHTRDDVEFVLSGHGNLLAEQSRHGAFIVRDVIVGSAPILLIPRGRYHNNIEASLGKQALLVGIGSYKHLIRWDGDRLEQGPAPLAFQWPVPFQKRKFPLPRVDQTLAYSARITPELDRLISILRPDPRRFASTHEGPVNVLVDRYSQIAILDQLWNLVCMFFVFRNQVAAWMPDGTRYGPASLTGGPETPDAAERIARRLQHAWLLGEGMSRSGRTGSRTEGGT